MRAILHTKLRAGIGKQGSHRHWKTWKNETTFSSQGKVREF